MPIVGIETDRSNPKFTKADFSFWLPQFSKYLDTEDGTKTFDKIYSICNQKIYKSIFGSDFELAMSYAIAHYLTLIGNQSITASSDKLSDIAGGSVHQGVMSSASVGGFSKSYDFEKTMLSNEESLFWNQTSYGSSLMALLATKPTPSIMIVNQVDYEVSSRNTRTNQYSEYINGNEPKISVELTSEQLKKLKSILGEI